MCLYGAIPADAIAAARICLSVLYGAIPADAIAAARICLSVFIWSYTSGCHSCC